MIMMELFLFGVDIQQIVGNVWYVVIGFIIFDVLTGILASAKERVLNSSINFEGLITKAGELLTVMFGTFLDAYLKTDGEVTKLMVGLVIVYEGLSVIENFSRIGIKLDFLTKYFDKSKIGKSESDD